MRIVHVCVCSDLLHEEASSLCLLLGYLLHLNCLSELSTKTKVSLNTPTHTSSLRQQNIAMGNNILYYVYKFDQVKSAHSVFSALFVLYCIQYTCMYTTVYSAQRWGDWKYTRAKLIIPVLDTAI